jgi:hypothetical protein
LIFTGEGNVQFVLRQIEIAIQKLYAFDSGHRVERFLMSVASHPEPRNRGALCIRGSFAEDSLEVGVYLSRAVQAALGNLSFDSGAEAWNCRALDAFSVASEEVSHFHYLLFHAERGRPVSELELEVQGEIDRFALCFFSGSGNTVSFSILFDRLFHGIRITCQHSEEKRSRYFEANSLAANWMRKHRELFINPAKRECLLKFLRRFYRLRGSDKWSGL